MPTSDMRDSDIRLLLLAPQDNILVAGAEVAAGETILIEGIPLVAKTTIGRGHKLARRAIALGDAILKYGAPIGTATLAIAPGEHVHIQNVKSNYTPTHIIGAVAEKTK